jgi:hypothetical protein
MMSQIALDFWSPNHYSRSMNLSFFLIICTQSLDVANILLYTMSLWLFSSICISYTITICHYGLQLCSCLSGAF